MQIGIILPSIRPEFYFELQDSLKYMGEYRKYFKILLLAQPPWSIAQFHQSDADHKQFIERIETPSMMDLRGKCYDLAPDCDYYMIADDDLLFLAEYKDFLKSVFNLIDKDYGVICTYGGNKHPHDVILNPSKISFATSRGMFIKNTDNLFPEKERKLLGGMEESIIAFSVLKTNKKYAAIGKAPVVRRKKHPDPSYNDTSFIHDLGVNMDHGVKYVRETYNDRHWMFKQKRIPEGLL
jgi:hypothetical protein